MLTVVEKVIFLQNVEVFAEIPTEQLSHLAAIADETACAKGETIYKHEDPSDALYVVLDGTVRLHRGEEEIAVVDSKDAFGTWALFDDTPRVTTATAVENGRLLRIYREDFLDILSDHTQIMEGVLKTLVGRLRGLLERVGLDISQRSSP
jgi:CRP-like cAMP-binding protein